MNNTSLTKDQIDDLLAVTDAEIYSLLGAAALATRNPIEILEAGRGGSFYQSAPKVLGPEIPFVHQGLERVARIFLKNWASQLHKAICENGVLSKQERAKGRREVDVVIATVIASVTSHIPELAGYSVLLNIIGVMVVRSGVNAFCQDALPQK